MPPTLFLVCIELDIDVYFSTHLREERREESATLLFWDPVGGHDICPLVNPLEKAKRHKTTAIASYLMSVSENRRK
ncbi:MAG: hypothetical protein HQK49_02870 [Oligoflexia bacterium]|nr:hypothetical protein [Oligoflexia bacterium]